MGSDPLESVAENVSGLPVQDGLSPAVTAMETVGSAGGFTTMEIGLESTGEACKQETLLVNRQVITSLLFKEEVVQVFELLPTGFPFTNH